MARPSALLRFARLLVGLVTLWCLGCSSYESILESLLGARADAMMACGGESSARSPEAAGLATSGQTIATVSAVNHAGSFDCGCGGSCHAPSLGLLTVSAPKAAIQVAAQFAPSVPKSVTRAPLLPPPEFAV